MARLLVIGPDDQLAARGLLKRLRNHAREAGHDAGSPDGNLKQAVRDADGVVVVLDGASAQANAIVGLAAAMDKPVLGLSAHAEHALSGLCRFVVCKDDEAAIATLEPFYEAVRPFAGRVVRDKIPELVREAGHDVAFREVGGEDRPRFLKQKVAAEAHELLRADVGKEKEEIADVLEALEAFILSRSFDREDLKRIKDAKRKRRGGFAKVYVVESTSA